MSELILETRDLSKAYGKKMAVNHMNLQIEKGKLVGLLGPNGSGKSTFIKMCNGIIQPSGGELLINGYPVGIETKKIVSYLPERTYLDNSMTPVDYIEYFSDFYEDFDANKAFDMLGSLKINPKDKLKTMSKGTKEKVQLILVLSRDAQLYILDEPIAGVDPAARDYILETMISNYNRNASMIITTHLIYDIERVLDDALFLKEGKIFMAGAVKDLEEQYGRDLNNIFREVFRC